MIPLSGIAVAIFMIGSSQYTPTSGSIQHFLSGTIDNVPWKNAVELCAYLDCLASEIKTSKEFTDLEKDDMCFIVDFMTSELENHDGSFRSVFMELYENFGPLLDQPFIREMVHPIVIKADALNCALSQCFIITKGMVDDHVMEIARDLISMFAEEQSDFEGGNDVR